MDRVDSARGYRHGAYDGDPDLIGPPEIYAWCRFKEAPTEPYLHTALVAQSTDAGTLYKQALRRETLLREELETVRGGAPGGALLERIRVLVESYEDLARLFASSEYSDDSLSQGGMIAADAFAQFGEATDRATALRLLTTLTKQFPNSPLNRQASARTRTLEQARPLAGVKLQEETVRVASLPDPKSASRVKGPEESTPVPAATATPPRMASTTPPAASTTAPAAASESAPRPAAAPGPVTLRAIRREVLPDALRITLELDREVPYYDERIDGPPRVFVDLPNTRAADTLKDATIPYPDGAVRQVRVGRQLDSRTRVVLDLNGAGPHRVYTQYEPYRVVIDFVRTTADAKASRPGVAPVPQAAALLASKPVALSRQPTRAPTVLAATISRSVRPAATPGPPATAARTTDVPAATTASAPAAPRQNAGGGFSLARQLGLGVTRIVIDPGHGGHDPGARVNGVSEASLVLDVATRLEELLRKEPGVEVVLTRRADTFVALEERTAIANRVGADLFLSIHVNASTAAAARGVETYFLNFATNPEAEAIAARENAGSAKSMRHLPDIVQAITLNSKIDESRDLATIIQSTLYDRLRKTNRTLKNLGVKQAPFVVLVGATMPSALAEISFMTNRSEAALLKTEKYRQQIAEALFAGITRYQGSVKNAIARAE